MVEPSLFDISDYRQPLPERVLVFASGCNRVSEIEGFAYLGIPIGVSVAQLDQDALDLLIALKLPIMADSGAFSEMPSAKARGTTSVISPVEWERRLAIYLRMASALQDKALLVVPDKVGDQDETLGRISKYRPWLARIAATGAKLLLPLQVGAMTHIDFYQTAQKVAGVSLLPAMPMRKAATSAECLMEFVTETTPSHLHLLGMGIDTSRAEALIRTVQHYSPSTFLTLDSNRLRAVVGRDRPLTRAEYEFRSAEIEDVFGDVISSVLIANREVLDYTDIIAFPSVWVDAERLVAIADDVHLCEQDRSLFLSSPDQFLQTSCEESGELTWVEHPVMEQALDREWRLHVERWCRKGVRRAAISSIFRTSRLRGQTSALSP